MGGLSNPRTLIEARRGRTVAERWRGRDRQSSTDQSPACWFQWAPNAPLAPATLPPELWGQGETILVAAVGTSETGPYGRM